MNLLGVQTDKLQAQGQTRKGTEKSDHPFTPIGGPTASCSQSLKKPILFGDLDNRGSTAIKLVALISSPNDAYSLRTTSICLFLPLQVAMTIHNTSA